MQNYHLEKHGHNERVDHRSLKDQGITEREPEKHLNGAGVRNTTAKNNLLELRAANAENVQAQTEAAPIVEQAKKQTVTLDIATNAAEKLKNKLAERAQAKAKAQAAADAEAQRQEQVKIEQNKIAAVERQKQADQKREATKPAPEQLKKTQSKDHDIEM